MSYTSEVLADSPRLYLRLGESAGPTAVDSSSLGHDGTYTGCTFSQPGAVGDADTAVLLDGLDDVIIVTDHADLDLGDSFSLELWVKRGVTGVLHHLINKGAGAYTLTLKATDVVGLLNEEVAFIAESTVTIADTTTWHHIVATKDGAAVFIYVDGADVTGTVTNSTCGNNTSDLFIGTKFSGGNQLSGSLDEVALYAGALPASRVTAHYAAVFAPPEQTAIWPFNRQGPF